MLLALILFAQSAAPVRIEAARDGDTCAIRVEGTAMAGPALEAAARGWAQQGRPIRVTAPGDTPYRCIGGTLFALQMAGYGGLVPEGGPALDLNLAATVRFFLPADKCLAKVNDVPVSDAQLEALVQDWRRYQPQVHFQPDPKADYRCVERMLALLKRARIAKLGFLGNEQYDPDL